MLATQGVKKAQAERALSALAEQDKIACKEFGKSKIYFPLQQHLKELSAEVGEDRIVSFFHQPNS